MVVAARVRSNPLVGHTRTLSLLAGPMVISWRKGQAAAPAAPLQFAAFTFTGNGVNFGDQQAVTGFGFRPKVAVCKGDTATNGHALVRTDTMSTSRNVTNSNTDAGIASLDADGITVQLVNATNGRLNVNGVTYYGYAFAGANCATLTYVGSGAAHGITGVGFQPVAAFVLPSDNAAIRYRTASMAANKSMDFGTSAGTTTNITSLDADGFSVGTSTSVNTNNTTYHAWCIKASDNFAEGTYTGNSTDDRNLPSPAMSFDPDAAHIKADAGQLCYWKVIDLAGDASFPYGTNANTTNQIQSLTPASGQFQVGSGAACNGNTLTEYYWCAKEAA